MTTKISKAIADKVLDKAARLSVKAKESLTLEQLTEAGIEAGIKPEYVKQALEMVQDAEIRHLAAKKEENINFRNILSGSLKMAIVIFSFCLLARTLNEILSFKPAYERIFSDVLSHTELSETEMAMLYELDIIFISGLKAFLALLVLGVGATIPQGLFVAVDLIVDFCMRFYAHKQ